VARLPGLRVFSAGREEGTTDGRYFRESDVSGVVLSLGQPIVVLGGIERLSRDLHSLEWSSTQPFV
jgi:hypothetical protein